MPEVRAEVGRKLLQDYGITIAEEHGRSEYQPLPFRRACDEVIPASQRRALRRPTPSPLSPGLSFSRKVFQPAELSQCIENSEHLSTAKNLKNGKFVPLYTELSIACSTAKKHLILRLGLL